MILMTYAFFVPYYQMQVSNPDPKCYYEPDFNKFLAGKDDLLRQCMWIWTIFGRFTNIEYEPLQHIATNITSMFTCDGKKYFGKFQTQAIKEDLLVDIVNCRLIEEYITSNPDASRYFMKLIGSSLTLLHKARNQKQFNLKDFKPCDTNCFRNQTLVDIITNNLNNYEKCKFALFEYIDGVTINQYINKTNRNLRLLSVVCHTLFQQLKKINLATGFCHNDAHIQNVMIVNNMPVLIDYGKSIFVKEKSKFTVHYIQEKEKMSKFYDDVCNEAANVCNNRKIKNFNTTALQIIADFVNSKSDYSKPRKGLLLNAPSYQQTDEINNLFIDIMYMFDVMTVSMNILYEVAHLDTLLPFMFRRVKDKIEDENIEVFHLLHPADIYALLSSDYSQQLSEEFVVYLPGLFWFSVIVYFFARAYGENAGIHVFTENDMQYFEIDYNNKVFVSLIYTSFQFINIDEVGVPHFIEHCLAFADNLREIESFAWNYNVSGGSTKRRSRTNKLSTRKTFNKLTSIKITTKRANKKKVGGANDDTTDMSYHVEDLGKTLPQMNTLNKHNIEIGYKNKTVSLPISLQPDNLRSRALALSNSRQNGWARHLLK